MESRKLLGEIASGLRGQLLLRSEWGVEGYSLKASLPEPQSSKAPSSLDEIEASLEGCTRCSLHASRTQIVFGVGNPRAEVVFVGEGPGREEDAQGEPFVGRAGKLLDRMISAMGFRREDVYICNAVKCRPPANRTPTPEEIAICRPFLEAQLEAIRPRVIIALGNPALRALLDITRGISQLRGQLLSWRGIPLMPTFHPAYLLRNPKAKYPAWQDLQKVLELLGRKPPARKGKLDKI